MPNSPHSSSASVGCRFEWRPSAIACGALIALGLVAGLSVLASGVARGLAWPAALLAPAWGIWLARCEWMRDPIHLHWRADGLLFVGGIRAQRATLQWRGPMAFLAWEASDGRRRRLVWWPDTLSPGKRRELRLAAAAADASRAQGPMAP